MSIERVHVSVWVKIGEERGPSYETAARSHIMRRAIRVTVV